ncbi:glycosyltransferase [Aliarcobacter cryaerophilus]|nr:glycosyltransferase [Aliarcobacter cryaerophilus]
MKLAPIVLFTYNRPWHTQQTIEALQKNELAKESELFIFSDGGKDEESWKKVNEVREYLKTIDGFKDIKIIEQEKNLGLADSIISGVTKIINKYGKIIVLEDDIVTSPYFLRFMNDALDFYENEEKVWHISGYIFPVKNIVSPEKTFFIKPTTCWGWATWKNKWKHFNRSSHYFLEQFNENMIIDFNLNNSYGYWSHLLQNHNRQIKTWAIFWYATVYLNNGLSLHPQVSFTDNIGHDNSGTHCGLNSNFKINFLNKEILSFCTTCDIDNIVQNQIAMFLKSNTKGPK